MGFLSKLFGGGEKPEWLKLVKQSYSKGASGEYWDSIRLAEQALELNPRASEAYRPSWATQMSSLGMRKKKKGISTRPESFTTKLLKLGIEPETSILG